MKKKKGYSLGTIVALALAFMVLSVGVIGFVIWKNASGGMSTDDPGATPVVPGGNQVQAPGNNSEIPINGENPGDSSGEKDPGSDSPAKPARQRKSEFYNILVVGRDVKGSNTDVMMVCSYDKPAGTVTLMQIPRDTYVVDPVNEGKSKRINAIYAFAYNHSAEIGIESKDRQKYALEYLEGTVERTFGLEIDRYVYVDLKAFREIVDIIGGVTVNVPQDMDYDDPEQDLHIHLKKGTQKLYGKDAEGFVRFRHGYLDGDLGRLDAQKIFLSALMDQLLSPKSIEKFPRLMSKVYEHLLTDLSLEDLVYLAGTAGGIDGAKTQMITAPGKALQSESGAWYYSLYTEDNLKVINEYLNCFTTPITEADVAMVQLIAKK